MSTESIPGTVRRDANCTTTFARPAARRSAGLYGWVLQRPEFPAPDGVDLGGGDVRLGNIASGHSAFPARSTGSEHELSAFPRRRGDRIEQPMVAYGTSRQTLYDKGAKRTSDEDETTPIELLTVPLRAFSIQQTRGRRGGRV